MGYGLCVVPEVLNLLIKRSEFWRIIEFIDILVIQKKPLRRGYKLKCPHTQSYSIEFNLLSILIIKHRPFYHILHLIIKLHHLHPLYHTPYLIIKLLLLGP